jgi:small-conductance mechanosensitive channel
MLLSFISDDIGRQAWSLLVAAGGALLVLALLFVAYRFLAGGILALEARGALPPYVGRLVQRLLGGFTLVIGVVVVLDRFGLMNNVWTLLSAALALVGVGFVAMWSVLSNILCWLLLLVVQPFRVGDTVEIVGQAWQGQNLQGQVEDVNLFYTTLRGSQNELIQVPNNLFFQTPIRRVTKPA